MQTQKTSLDEVMIIKPDIFEDQRGFFFESFNKKRYKDCGIEEDFVQDNISFSLKGVLRGLHFQIKKPQAKLVQVISGSVYDVAVDIRPASATFGKWTGINLTEKNRLQFFIPKGFAHGFCVLSSSAVFLYKCSDFYDSKDEGGIIWSDPDIAIDWPVKKPILSEKDASYKTLMHIKTIGVL